MSFLYKGGFVIGRFQHVHAGHERIIDQALAVCDKVLILVGSSQKGGPNERDERNPFSATLRIDLINEIYKAYDNRVMVDGLPDMTSEDDICDDWGQYLLNNVGLYFEGGLKTVDLMIYGNDEHRMGWFDFEESKKMAAHIDEMIVSRGTIDISATRIRQYLLEDNFSAWSQFVNPVLWNRYGEIREALISTKGYEGEADWL